MDSEDKGMGVTEGSSKETKKRGRPKKNADPPKKHSVSREKNADPPIIHSVSPSLIAESPPPGFPSKFLVWPVKNRTSLATGSVSAGVSQSKAVHGAVSETLGSVSAGGSQSKATPGAVSENLGSGRTPKLECNTNMKTEEAQRQMHQFTSTVTELCTGFETLKKENKELRKQVTDLEGQNQKWKDQEASWDVKKKELERECDEARKEALAAVGKKRDIEEKLEKAVKEVNDAKTTSKKAIYEAVASTTRCYKNCVGSLVASLGNGEGESLKNDVKELIKEILCDDIGPSW
nr:PREDICTED: uncharacterized protein LOC108195787 [Daucus carota subsp. sativus]